MKPSPLPKILLAILAVLAVLSAFYCYSAIKNGRELRDLQTKVALINQRQGVLNALAMDLLEYSKKNAAINPLLESMGIIPGKTNPAAPATTGTVAPAVKPATK